jgi:hypothetical protein
LIAALDVLGAMVKVVCAIDALFTPTPAYTLAVIVRAELEVLLNRTVHDRSHPLPVLVNDCHRWDRRPVPGGTAASAML